MSCPQVYARVVNGPYLGFTREEMEAELERYKKEMKLSGSRLVGSTVNNESFQFGPRNDWSLPEWGKQIQFALAQVSPDFIAPQSTIFFRFC